MQPLTRGRPTTGPHKMGAETPLTDTDSHPHCCLPPAGRDIPRALRAPEP